GFTNQASAFGLMPMNSFNTPTAYSLVPLGSFSNLNANAFSAEAQGLTAGSIMDILTAADRAIQLLQRFGGRGGTGTGGSLSPGGSLFGGTSTLRIDLYVHKADDDSGTKTSSSSGDFEIPELPNLGRVLSEAARPRAQGKAQAATADYDGKMKAIETRLDNI